MNPTLPEGFKNQPKDSTRTYRSAESTSRSPQTLNFRGRPGGPGRGMAQTVEHASDKKGTLTRLLQCFHQIRVWKHAAEGRDGIFTAAGFERLLKITIQERSILRHGIHPHLACERIGAFL